MHYEYCTVHIVLILVHATLFCVFYDGYLIFIYEVQSQSQKAVCKLATILNEEEKS